jgi:plastocyanin
VPTEVPTEATPAEEAPTEAPAEAPANGGQTEVVLEDLEFVPQGITVAAGTTIVWQNDDGVPHTVTAGERGNPTGMFDQNVGAGGTFSFTFDEPGTYPYYCSIHAGMDGVVTVTE